jgi:hypothetical protein
LPPPSEVDFIFEFLVPSVFLNGVGILGLVGNLLSIFILSRPQMKGSTNCILIGLATYDSILILSRYVRQSGVYFTNMFTCSFYTCRSQKCKVALMT